MIKNPHPQKSEKSTRKRGYAPWVALATLLLVSLGCIYFNKKFDIQSTPDSNAFISVEYAGVVKIATFSACETQANATLTAYADHTCKLSLNYPRTYSLPDGNCKPAEDNMIIAWNIFGKFDDSIITCNFDYCNKPSYYSASGAAQFSPNLAWADNEVTCTSKSNGETDITINGVHLVPSTE